MHQSKGGNKKCVQDTTRVGLQGLDVRNTETVCPLSCKLLEGQHTAELAGSLGPHAAAHPSRTLFNKNVVLAASIH